MGKKYYIGNVLVVDDQPVNLSLVEKMLQDLPIRIIKATSGKEAIQIAEKERLALILMDVQMPGMDGFETADKIKQLENAKSTPIIFVTAIGTDAEHIQRGYEAGAVDYIIKPVTPFVLRSKVQIFLEMDEKYEEIDDMLRHLEEKNRAFKNTLNTIRMNQGLVPICSWCRKIKNDKGEWEQIEEYITRISAAEFTHGVCPHCAAVIRGQMNNKK
jgi:CheY-like chemotaxis protein